jgi:hypothetical protein
VFASVQIKSDNNMPQNGEVNQRFGVYRNVCCGQEIMIRERATFPDCKKHPKLTTIWKPVDVPKGSTEANGFRRKTA